MLGGWERWRGSRRIGGIESVIIYCLKKLNKKRKSDEFKANSSCTMFCHFQTWGLADNSVLMAAEWHFRCCTVIDLIESI